MRESSAERRAKIEQWNREREEVVPARDDNSKADDTRRDAKHDDDQPYDDSAYPPQGNGRQDF